MKARTSLREPRNLPIGRGFGRRGNGSSLSRGKGFQASVAQRVKVKDLTCVVCGNQDVDPAHLIPRGLTSEGQEDPVAVVPLCRTHHREFDAGELDLLPFLEPRYLAEVAFAVERVGLVMALQRITNSRWSMDGWAH